MLKLVKNQKLYLLFIIPNSDKFELRVLYADDVCDEIKEAESRRPTVESGKIVIDASNNYLEYGDEAVIANVSAFCIKEVSGKPG